MNQIKQKLKPRHDLQDYAETKRTTSTQDHDEQDILIQEKEREVKSMQIMVIVTYIVLMLLGIGTGYLLSGKGSIGFPKTTTPTVIKTDNVVGSTDTQTFKDSAEGVIEKGGIDGEGSHKLVREGGPSQTAYLISSVIDLDEYAGKKVKVWGQTIAAKKAAWLMDVGKIEIE